MFPDRYLRDLCPLSRADGVALGWAVGDLESKTEIQARLAAPDWDVKRAARLPLELLRSDAGGSGAAEAAAGRAVNHWPALRRRLSYRVAMVRRWLEGYFWELEHIRGREDRGGAEDFQEGGIKLKEDIGSMKFSQVFFLAASLSKNCPSLPHSTKKAAGINVFLDIVKVPPLPKMMTSQREKPSKEGMEPRLSYGTQTINTWNSHVRQFWG